MTQTIHIRRATYADAAELARLRWDFSPDEVATGSQTLAEWNTEFARFLKSALDSGNWVVWVAESEGQLIANIWVYLVPKVPRPERFGKRWGYVTNVYASPQVRGAGIGSTLMRSVIAWAEEQGLELLLVWPSLESRSFYARAGFNPSTETMELHLEEE